MAAFWKILSGIPLSSHRCERGAALFIILMVVVLYAALSYAVAKTTSGGSGPEREVQMVETSTLQQDMNIRVAEFQRLLIRGCAPSEIYPYSMTQAEVDEGGFGFGLPAITNADCAMYMPHGGSLSRMPLSVAMLKMYKGLGFSEIQAKVYAAYNDDPIYAANFPGVGSGGTDLYFLKIIQHDASSYAKAIKACNHVNKTLGIDFVMDDSNFSQAMIVISPFSGSLATTYSALMVPAAFHGRNAACLLFASAAIYYQIAYEQ